MPVGLGKGLQWSIRLGSKGETPSSSSIIIPTIHGTCVFGLFSVVTHSIVQSVIFVLAGNVNEFGEETMHKVLVKKSFGKRLGRLR